MLFLGLDGARFLEGNADEYYATKWGPRQKGDFTKKSAYLDPVLGSTMHKTWAEEEGVDFMYGGYQEDRSRILKGTYLDETGGYVHQGVDFYVPAGTPVVAEHEGYVVCIDNDHPEEGGWGMRIAYKPRNLPGMFLFAHLGPNVHCRIGDSISAGHVIAEVGAYPGNGGWPAEHLHLQYLSELGRKRFHEDKRSVDGYGHPRDMMLLERLYLDPRPHFTV